MRRMRLLAESVLRAWLLVLPLVLPTMAWANAGPPSWGGQIVAEPVGVVDVQIQRETLTIDLRPVAMNGLARVEAIYQLQNPGAEKKLDLLFASGSASMADFQVWLDGQPVPSTPAKNVELPPSWQPPQQTPGLHGEEGLDYLRFGKRNVIPVAFTIVIPPGRHQLKVRYSAEAAKHRGFPVGYRQFAYVLAPARAWSSFGGLDVTIHLPENWRAACTPVLHRHRDTLTGHFTDLPADAIALTIQAPEAWGFWAILLGSWTLFGLVGIGGAVICWRGGRKAGRRLALHTPGKLPWLKRHAWPTSIRLALGWGVAVFLTGSLAVLGPEWTLRGEETSPHSSMILLAMLGVSLLSMLVVLLGFMIAQVTAVVVFRRNSASHAEPAAAAVGTEQPSAAHS